MISHKHKCIFIHIPKTAGTSVEDVIWPLNEERTESNLWMGFINTYGNKYQSGGLQHLKALQIEEEVGAKIFNDYYKFSIVRNPWDRCVSQFEYIKQKRKDLRNYLGLNRFTSFKKYLTLIEKKEHVQWMRQVDFLYSDHGKCLVDKIIKYEHLNEEFAMVLDSIGIDNQDLPHKNKSYRKHLSKYYDDETIAMVRDLYNPDIQAFNYTYE